MKVNSRFYNALKFLHIIRECPNCESAWTGGCRTPEDREFCCVCGVVALWNESKYFPPGWIWNFPRFIRRRITEDRAKSHLTGIREGHFEASRID